MLTNGHRTKIISGLSNNITAISAKVKIKYIRISCRCLPLDYITESSITAMWFSHQFIDKAIKRWP